MAESIKLESREMLKVNSGFNALDSMKISKDEIVVFEFTAQVTWNLAKNASIFDQAKERHDKRIRKIISDNKLIEGETVDDKNRDRVMAVKAAEEIALADEVELHGLLFIKVSELLNKRKAADGKRDIINHIPVKVLRQLSPIIEDDMDPK